MSATYCWQFCDVEVYGERYCGQLCDRDPAGSHRRHVCRDHAHVRPRSSPAPDPETGNPGPLTTP